LYFFSLVVLVEGESSQSAEVSIFEDDEEEIDVELSSTIPSDVMISENAHDAYSDILKNSEPYYLGTVFVGPGSLVAPEPRFMRRPVSGILFE
jgi:hypothetical protein